LTVQTPIKLVAGLDVSKKCLEETRLRLKCTTYLGTILDFFCRTGFTPLRFCPNERCIASPGRHKPAEFHRSDGTCGSERIYAGQAGRLPNDFRTGHMPGLVIVPII
jgi:hypothetical protein